MDKYNNVLKVLSLFQGPKQKTQRTNCSEMEYSFAIVLLIESSEGAMVSDVSG